jgi:hypothetical protein
LIIILGHKNRRSFGYALTPNKDLVGVTDEILVPPIEITGVREKREITGATTTTPERATTVTFDSTATAPAESGLASTLTSMRLPYATVIRTIPVESHVIVKLPLVEDWSEPKSTYPISAFAAAEAPESS